MRLSISLVGYSRSYASWVRLPRNIPINNASSREHDFSRNLLLRRVMLLARSCGRSFDQSLTSNALWEPNVPLTPLRLESSHDWHIRQSSALAQRANRRAFASSNQTSPYSVRETRMAK